MTPVSSWWSWSSIGAGRRGGIEWPTTDGSVRRRRRCRRSTRFLFHPAEHLGLHGELRIGDQHHHAAIRIDLGHLADQAGAVGHGHTDSDAVSGADGDLDGVLEVARRLTDDLGDHALVAVHRGEPIQLEQFVELGDRRLRLDLGTLLVLDLIVQRLVLRSEIVVVGDAVPCVGNRLRHRFCGDVERSHDHRKCLTGLVDHWIVAAAIEGDQQQRGQNEQHNDAAAAQRGKHEWPVGSSRRRRATSTRASRRCSRVPAQSRSRRCTAGRGRS